MQDTGKAIDPVCGMQVSCNSPHAAVHQGQRFVFCCDGCRQKFVANPDQYIKTHDAEHHVHSDHHEK
ncbi:MAG: YHS domain-containing protein, partial [Steroidobacter sp.]